MSSSFQSDLGRIDDTSWGPWRLDREALHIYRVGTPEYCLDFNDLCSHLFVRTLREIEGKLWADNQSLGGLVRAAFAIRRALGELSQESPSPDVDPSTFN